MTLPNADKAFVPREKLTDYLLALSHPIGGPKAAFFRRHGFDDTHLVALEAGLLLIARNAQVEAKTGKHGTKYVADGDLLTPRGRTVPVRTVWLVEPAEPRPRFITAYPLSRA